MMNPDALYSHNTWLALAKQPDADRSIKSVITADTFFFTENRDLKVVITANRLVF